MENDEAQPGEVARGRRGAAMSAAAASARVGIGGDQGLDLGL